MQRSLPWVLLVGYYCFPSCCALFSDSLSQRYAEARTIRTFQGHDAAQPFYQSLLEDNPQDVTAATYVAASVKTNQRHDAACGQLDSKEEHVEQLRNCFRVHNFTNRAIQELLHVPTKQRYASCPIYITPQCAGEITSKIPTNGLECLVTLFLVGLTINHETVEQHLGMEFITLLETLGLAFLDNKKQRLIPYVHIYPVETSFQDNLWFVTDLHPNIINTIQVGNHQHAPVMYLGPDSIALVQQFQPPVIMEEDVHILDLCTGSGIQGISFAAKQHSNYTLTCVDVNPRCLHFCRFNALLNQLSNVQFLLCDLLEQPEPSFVDIITKSQLATTQEVTIVLANPPFIPVPPTSFDVLQRYGLFSSGGPDGEVILKAIFRLLVRKNNDTTRLMKLSKNAWIGIVTEVMNPSTALERWSRLLLSSSSYSYNGILLTNQHAVPAHTYAKRRADWSKDELSIWIQHLQDCKIDNISPGILILRAKRQQSPKYYIELKVISPSKWGNSIWTPWNRHATEMVHEEICKLAADGQ